MFRLYIPVKPAEYGIKIFTLCDNITYYTSNLEIHAGKQPESLFSIDDSASEIVKQLVSPISKTGRNITADNGYKPSLQLSEQRVRVSGRCKFCDKRDRKTTKVYSNCAKLICRDHLVEVCPECFSDM